ncbi:MAG: GNAT family N-acetyltransferase [Clostridia bacterium]|nr:GNAT family N-acetyltransferase [Clostridia bacterium]
MKREHIYEVFSKTPTFETERLNLRQMQMFDAFDMYEYARAPETSKFLTWNPHPDIEYTKNYLAFIINKYKAGEFYDWAVTLKSDENKMIGTCGFSKIDFSNNVGEIGYVINPEYHGYGYATEAAKRIIEFGFNKLGFRRIEGKFIIGNDASLAVMKKCGMTYEGTLRDSMLIKGVYRDIGICSILANEF